MRWLMSLAGDRPVIEYCGGTEIGGGYITGTVTRACLPGAFNTPALGLDFVILDEKGRPADNGELFIVPPSIGLSTTLLDQDHHQLYFAETPPGPHGELLRRHGDEMEKLPGGYWRAHGRADDTMNLGGIKVSSAEIEQALQSLPGLTETAAIAVAPGGGPSQLVIYAACSPGQILSKQDLAARMQEVIKRDLNPFFKVHELVLVDALPRTASNKVMRRVLRERWLSR
jgi:acetyl-CoA synthetase